MAAGMSGVSGIVMPARVRVGSDVLAMFIRILKAVPGVEHSTVFDIQECNEHAYTCYI